MGQAMWIFVFLVLLHVSLCRTETNCSEHQPEKKFLSNIDKLLNLNRVKITSGMVLKKKENTSNQPVNNNLACNNSLVENVGLRIKRLMETHVIEFDLASVLAKGETDTLYM